MLPLRWRKRDIGGFGGISILLVAQMDQKTGETRSEGASRQSCGGELKTIRATMNALFSYV